MAFLDFHRGTQSLLAESEALLEHAGVEAHFQLVAGAELGLEVLAGADAFQSTVYHDADASTQGLALL
jgi:hypothetical protein